MSACIQPGPRVIGVERARAVCEMYLFVTGTLKIGRYLFGAVGLQSVESINTMKSSLIRVDAPISQTPLP